MRLWLVLASTCAIGVLAAAAAGSRTGSFKLHGSVVHVVDGDTIDVELDSGRRTRVRLIGVDTPERGQCFFTRATNVTERLAASRRVVLQGDATQATRDRYGRLLAYVWLPGGHDLGLQLLKNGVARVYVYDRPFVRLAVYNRAERAAKKSPNSLWRRCAARHTGRCDPSYPDVCIPPPPPDLDCSDIPYRNFRVVGRDPHHFDGNHNGIGCER
jgi:endonuclease YncB( thermonuclease family)